MDEQTKNLILATALSFLVFLTWMFLFPPEPIPEEIGTSENQTSQTTVSYTHLTLPTNREV